MNERTLLCLTKEFSLAVFYLVQQLPKTLQARAVADQLFRSATSTASNYRAARRARTRAEFCAKLGIVLEEVDESQFWLEFIENAGLLGATATKPLWQTADQISRLVFTSRRTALKNLPKKSQ
jgi:four helix bundle protein